MSSIGLIIKELRQRKKLTQTQLADLISVKVNTMSNYETGISEPNVEKIELLAKIFEVSTDELLGIKTYQPPKNDVLPLNEPLNNYEMEKLNRSDFEFLKSQIEKKDQEIEFLRSLVTPNAQPKKKEVS